ncbi:RAB3GAP2 family protein [Megaselia abdita]
MSCEVKCLSSVPDLPKVQEFLGFSHDENWLNTVYLSISPTHELMVFGHGCKLIFLSRTSDGTNSSYTVSWSGEIQNPNEVITSVLCLPIFGHNVASGAEWTSVAVGLSSGLVVFYTDSGIQIFSQRWSQEQVISIKAYSRSNEEVIQIGYLKCICILQSTHLVSVLRSQKNYYQPNEGAIGGSTKSKTDVVVVPCRKWDYEYVSSSGSPSVNDSCLVGPQETGLYDYIVEQCLNRGSSAKPRSSPPQNTLILSAGAKPYVGFNYAKEGYIPADLSEVAKEVASKVSNSLASWFFKPKETKKEPVEVKEAAIPTGEKMSCRFGLCDIDREAVNVWICPFSKIAAVADNLQRVILVDCHRGVAFKMFKGYRDAQCAFIKVKEKKLDGKRNGRATALFLVAYAPKRSCLEIWVLQNGPRVAAFNVSKYGQLVYNNHSLLGIPTGVKAKYTSTSCFFLDPSDCFLKEISIPFHCALSSVQNVSNSKTAKDIHFLRQLKNLFRSKSYDKDESLAAEVRNICGSVETLEIKVLCLEFLKQAKKKISPSLFYVAVKTLKGTVDKDNDFYGILENYCKVVSFYLSDVLGEGDFDEKLLEIDEKLLEIDGKVSESDEKVSESDEKVSENDEDLPMEVSFEEQMEVDECNELGLNFDENPEDPKPSNDPEENKEENIEPEDSEKLQPQESIGTFSENDMQPLEELLSILSEESKEEVNQSQNTSKVTFLDISTSDQTEKNQDFFEFLNSFEITPENITLSTKKEKSFKGIGEQVFVKYIRNEVDLQEFEDRARKSGISAEDFIRMILYSWMDIDFMYSDKNEVLKPMTRLGKVIKVICDLAGDKVLYNYDEICDWWQFIREMVLECPCALRGLVFAIVCKHVSVKFLRREDNEDEGNWEQVSHEAAQWTLLIGKLDDIAILGSILGSSQSSSSLVMPKISETYEKPNCSLKALLCGSKSIVSELTANWLINSQINPQKIVEIEENGESVEPPTDPVLVHLVQLRKHFPFSLESGMVLCHMVWEFMSHWSKNLSSLEYLQAGLKCLEAFRKEDQALKHGLCCLVWNAHMKIPLEATKKLINKAGRLPKDKLCQQDLGISVTSVSDFLQNCIEFLEKHFQVSMEFDQQKDIMYEEILNGTQEQQFQLQFLALQQNHAILELLKLHVELCKVLHLIAVFQMKIPKPMNLLFDAMSNQTFFLEMNKELQYVLPSPDRILQSQRKDFLCKAVTASVDLVREDLEHLYVEDHEAFMRRIENLADMWKLDKKRIKRHQVIELYANGWDSFANDLLQQIVDDEKIGGLLLEIAGRRLNLYASNSQSTYLKIASIGPYLLNYLDNLVSVATVYYTPPDI